MDVYAGKKMDKTGISANQSSTKSVDRTGISVMGMSVGSFV